MGVQSGIWKRIFRVPQCALLTVYIKKYEQSCTYLFIVTEWLQSFGSVGVLWICRFRHTRVSSSLCNLGL